MKKSFSIFILISFLNLLGAFAFEDVFKDSLADTLDKSLKIQKPKYEPIVDEFAQNTLEPNLKIPKYFKVTFVDEFANMSLNPDLKIQKPQKIVYHDELLPLLKGREIEKRAPKVAAIFSDGESYFVKIRPQARYSTRNNLKEGQYIDFKLAQDTKIFDTVYKKDTLVKARVETVSKNQAYGVPSDVVIGNFKINDKTYDAEISLTGANRALWVYPLGYCLIPFFGAGLFVFPIRGGHAKFVPSKTYQFEVY